MNVETMIATLANGFAATFAIFILTLLGSLPLGLLVSFGRMSKWAPFRRPESGGKAKGLAARLASFRPLSFLVKIYISVMRGTPLMLQLMVVFFGPSYLLGMRVGSGWRFTAVIVAFVLNYAAYFAEIYRAGIESMPEGQYEAASVLGYKKSQTFFRIIFPQVIKRILPPVTNEVITLVKDTSLAYVIGTVEMFTKAKQIAASWSTLMPFLIAAVFYYIFNYLVAWAMERSERAFGYYR